MRKRLKRDKKGTEACFIRKMKLRMHGKEESAWGECASVNCPQCATDLRFCHTR
jgi:hypothetical protein